MRVHAEATAQPKGYIRLPEVDPLEVEGNLLMAGSSVVSLLARVMYQRFIDEGYAGLIRIERIGTGDAFKRFCANEDLDIVLAGRRIEPAEQESCARIGRKPIAFRVGTDAIVVVVHPSNYFVTDVTRPELAAILTAERWSHVHPAWPDEVIHRFFPLADSGPLRAVSEAIFDSDPTPLSHVLHNETSADHADLAEYVAFDPNGLSFFEHVFYQRWIRMLKALHIEGMEADQETVQNLTYPLLRPLFLYTDPIVLQNKSQVGAFINFVLTHVNEEIEAAGMFAAEPGALNEAKMALAQALGYPIFLASNPLEPQTLRVDQSKPTPLTIGTGSRTGVYYPIGWSIARLINTMQPTPHMKATAIVTQGSVFNVNAVIAGDLTFGIAQSDRLYQARHGLAEWQNNGSQRALRSVLSLYPESVTLVATEHSGIRSLSGLKGKRVNLGHAGSESRRNAIDILHAFGIDETHDLSAEGFNVTEGPRLLQAGDIDAFFSTVGHPVQSIKAVTSSPLKTRLIPIMGDSLEALLRRFPYYSKTSIPKGFYPQAANTADVQTVGMKAIVVTSSTVPEATVYAVVKEIFEHFHHFKTLHPTLTMLTQAQLLDDLGVPLHPGAIKYYREIGFILPIGIAR
jgi:TRAP transporter TAXI family solute receptor